MFVYFCRCLYFAWLGWTISISGWESWLKCLCCRWWRLGRQKTLKTSGIWKSNRRLKSNQRTKANRGLGQKVQWKLRQNWWMKRSENKLKCENQFFSLSVSWRAKGQNIRHNSDPAEVSGIIRTSNMADLWCWTKQVNMKFKTINCTYRTARVRHAPYCHQPLQIIPAKDPPLQNWTEEDFCLCSR